MTRVDIYLKRQWVDPFTVLLTFHIMGPVRENRRHHWKKRPKISKGAKFESDK